MSAQKSGLLLSSRIYEVLKTVTLTASALFVAAIAVVVVSGRGEGDASTPAPADVDDQASAVVVTKGESQNYSLDGYRSMPIVSPHWLYLVASDAHAETVERAMQEASVVQAHESGTLLIYEIEVVPVDADVSWYLADAGIAPRPGFLDELSAASGFPPLRVVDLR